jgi:hypothetical protein
MTDHLRHYIDAIQRSGLSIYDPIEVGDPELWIPTPELETLLDQGLRNISLAGLPLRTRSKVIKEHICRVLGYPIPKTFKKTQPRFPGQFFDAYTQKSNNLQVWNQELSPHRRYVLIRVSNVDIVNCVKVVTGETLALLDTTGTLTQKYQARCTPGDSPTELISSEDTELLLPFTETFVKPEASVFPTAHPLAGQLLPIAVLYERLSQLVGTHFKDVGRDQERNRGTVLHKLVCQVLGYEQHLDDGRFPDIRHQLLEIKMQTSATIDLGLVRPDSTEALDVPQIQGCQIRHCDVRYAIFYCHTDGTVVTLTHLLITTGEAFFTRFPQFQGRVLNRKLQIPLPDDFFR